MAGEPDVGALADQPPRGAVLVAGDEQPHAGRRGSETDAVAPGDLAVLVDEGLPRRQVADAPGGQQRGARGEPGGEDGSAAEQAQDRASQGEVVG